jgi:oxysterol-binding protein-related protein 9/10/11
MLVLRWFISALKGQQYAGRDPSQGIKKPLNAFLGELFLSEWNDDAGKTHLVSEQVSHHPPVTACCLWNDEHGVRAEGYTCQEITASMTGTVSIKQIGHAILHLDKFNEDYLVPVPDVKVKGVFTGTPYPELNGTYHILSSSGYHSKIEFSGRGLFRGTKNSFHAYVFHKDAADKPGYEMEGQWTDSFSTKDLKNGKEVEKFDSNAVPATEMSVPPQEQQDPWESRRAWGGVIDALNKGDMQKTSDEKSKVEQAQRDLRKKEEAEGKQWKTLFFNSKSDSELFEKLAQGFDDISLEADKTVGAWRFNWDAYKSTQKPFRGEATPLG